MWKNLSKTILPRQNLDNQVWMFLIPTTVIWVELSLVIGWLLHGSNFTTHQVGKTLALMALPVYGSFGIHEFAHYIIGSDYCEFETVDFESTYSILGLDLISTIWIVSVVLADKFFHIVNKLDSFFQGLGLGIPHPALQSILILGLVATPGGVLLRGKSKVPRCKGDVAIAGPLANLVSGVVILWQFGWSLPAISMGHSFAYNTLGIAMYLSLYLATFNALPLKAGGISTDGYKVATEGDYFTWSLLALCLVIPPLLIYGVIP